MHIISQAAVHFVKPMQVYIGQERKITSYAKEEDYTKVTTRRLEIDAFLSDLLCIVIATNTGWITKTSIRYCCSSQENRIHKIWIGILVPRFIPYRF